MKSFGCSPDLADRPILLAQLLRWACGGYAANRWLFDLSCLLPETSQVVIEFSQFLDLLFKFRFIPCDLDLFSQATYGVFKGFIL